MKMEEAKELYLKRFAVQLRMGVIESVYRAKSGHPGGSLSIAEVLTYLYNEEMRVRPNQPDWEERDRLVLSKGHCAPALYSALALMGYFPKEELLSLRKLGSILQGHPDMKNISGVDMSTGSLGQGISAACGMALAGKLQKKDYRVYTILGDGELEEGQVWEASMFASHRKLDNLCVIVDNNNLQIDGFIGDVCSPYPIDKKFEAFSFSVIKIKADDFSELEKAFDKAKETKDKPTAVILSSIKGKGVSFMENQANWHGVAPNDEQYAMAMEELKQAYNNLGGKN